MILLAVAKMPDGANRDSLTASVGLLFPHKDNESYIQTIRTRQDDRAACESLFALTLLHSLLRMLPAPPREPLELILTRGDQNDGKPRFRNASIRFNLSHSRGYVACAVSDGEEVGVDLEASALTADRAQKLAERYLSAKEQEEYANDPKKFLRRWTELEAEAKFHGESVGKILSSHRNSNNSIPKSALSLHRFSFDGIPITLCTKRDHSTIFYCSST